jgi:hypothetical protein
MVTMILIFDIENKGYHGHHDCNFWHTKDYIKYSVYVFVGSSSVFYLTFTPSIIIYWSPRNTS